MPAPRLLGHGTYDAGIMVRHTVEGSADGRYETIWRERIEPLHDLILEALLDNIEAAAALAGGRRFRRGDPGETVEFRAADGAGEHCESGARTLFHRRAFDWLDAVLQPRADEPDEPGGVSGVRGRALLTPPA